MSHLPVVLACALCFGCFVFEELDEGQKLMEQLGPGKNAEQTQQSAPARQQAAGPGVIERVQTWWSDFRKPERPAPDPNDRIVRCTLGGSAQFMRESDCELRGGRPQPSEG